MQRGSIHIGTSGWSYKHWTGHFYPPNLAAAKYLMYYAEHFDTVELNSSFYNMPATKTAEKWKAQLPQGFKICPKMSRLLTHYKKLEEPDSVLERFFGIFGIMAGILGPILIQLPAYLAFDPATAAYLYKTLRNNYGSYSFAIEVRHVTWLSPESITLMKKYQITLVWAQSGRFVYQEELTAHDVYIRLHGPGKLYASSYPKATLSALAGKIHKLQQSGKNTWVFFNNDLNGYAIENALFLKDELAKYT